MLIARSVLVAVFVVGAILGAGFGVIVSQQQESPEPDEYERAADSRENKTSSGFPVARYIQEYAEYCDQEPGDKNSKWLHHTACEKSSEVVIAVFTVVLALFTGCLIFVGVVQWIALTRSVKVANDAMVASGRAFVFADTISPFGAADPITGEYHWSFRPKWRNSGDTPTKNMTMYTECVLRDSPLPIKYDFEAATSQTNIGKALIPPKTATYGGIGPRPPAMPISPQDIRDIRSGRKFLYLWGWAKYHDVFDGTLQHVTRFCWSVLPSDGDFHTLDGIIFDTIHHRSGNCADDECE